MYYDYEFYKDMDRTMDVAIWKTLSDGWRFVKTLFLTIVFTVTYIAITPIRIAEYIREGVYLAKVSEIEEQKRFNKWKNTGRI